METHPDSNFTPPRHWVGPQELEPAYWSDPSVLEKRSQEFYEKPIEMIDRIDRLDQTGLARRDFLTVMGASMALASFACARRPVHKIIPYVVKPEEITPGVANWYASTCKECSSGCGILVKTREGRPIKTEGNPEHPINRGKLCARGQASVLNLYDPERLKGPLSLNRNGGGPKEITWDEADAVIGQRMKGLGASGRVRVLSGGISSGTTRKLIAEFLAAFKGTHVEYEPLQLEEIAESQEKSYGTSVVPRYRFDEAEVVLSFGADFLSNWISPVEHAVDWVKRRKLDSSHAKTATLSKFYCFEPTLTVTGGNADERFPIRSGDELKIALAVAHELIIGQRHSIFAGDASVAAALGGYSAETVAKEVGMSPGKIQEIARELWKAKGKSLVVGGSIQSKTKDALALQLAINLLNSALENDGSTIDGTLAVGQSHSNFAEVQKLVQDMNSGQVDVLILYRSNPAYTLPKSMGFEEALRKVQMVISVSDREDETAKLGDFVLPDHHFLENWGDSSPRKGTYSLQQPAIAPILSTRSFEDSLLVWVKRASLNTGGIAVRTESWHDYLQAVWRDSIYREAGAMGRFEQFWEAALRDGVYDAAAAQGGAHARPSARSFRTESLSKLPKFSAAAKGMILATYAKTSMGDGRCANNAWLQEMPDPVSGITWDNYLNIAPEMAKSLGIQENDVVEVSAADVSVELPAHIQPGMHANAVSAAVGYGRTSVGKVGNQAGIGIYPFSRPLGPLLAYSGQEVALRKTGRFYQLANTQWHTVTENRPVINDVTLAAYRKNPAVANETDPELRMETVPTLWPVHEYKGYRWGMAIDLTSCTGCGACVIACQAENNVPVVGRDQVRVSRQMHWIRIDRYYAGGAENPDVLFQPMLCQHCENASCETVCPVLATVHDDEGLNVQVYNRCVGTRYCQNNCPYKVRRFNFFDHWKSYEGTMNMVWNPDVTVRTRGIMEKCTFCTQRIREARDHAKDMNRKIQDGDILTACQQTCPTDAIVFGDVNDPNSRVSKLRGEQRAFRVLENLNNKPMISYMTKVRNKEGGNG